ncbi:hypothetical protein IGA66_26450, partial [Pseudomonas aeruginosa]|uniref:hypothetical protein n=1 Tax=Pseudomonas aeruginosa TaxID=287 RepID=UPI00223764E7
MFWLRVSDDIKIPFLMMGLDVSPAGFSVKASCFYNAGGIMISGENLKRHTEAVAISGRKGGSSKPKQPVEAPDSLRSVAMAKILLA